jgi:hypothetical protein
VKDVPGDVALQHDCWMKKQQTTRRVEGAGQLRHGVGVGNLAARPRGRRMGTARPKLRRTIRFDFSPSRHNAAYISTLHKALLTSLFRYDNLSEALHVIMALSTT